MSEEIKEITYKKLSQIERFVGPDIEDAPDDCSPGSTFFEAQEGSDVGRLYVFDGTRWAEKQQRVTGITLEGENINIVDPETLGKEATLQILKAELAAIKSAQTDGSQKVTLSGNIVELFRRTNITLTAGSRIQLNPEPIDVSAFRGWQIGVSHADQYLWRLRKIWYTGVFYHTSTDSGFYEVDEMQFRDISPVYPCLGDLMYWWMSSDGAIDTPNFSVRIWGVK